MSAFENEIIAIQTVAEVFGLGRVTEVQSGLVLGTKPGWLLSSEGGGQTVDIFFSVDETRIRLCDVWTASQTITVVPLTGPVTKFEGNYDEAGRENEPFTPKGRVSLKGLHQINVPEQAIEREQVLGRVGRIVSLIKPEA